MIRYLIPYELDYIEKATEEVYLPIVVLMSKPMEEEVSIPKLAVGKRNGKDRDLYEKFLEEVEYVRQNDRPMYVILDKLTYLMESSIRHHKLYPTMDKVLNIELACFRSLMHKGVEEKQEIDVEWLWKAFKSCLLEFQFIDSVLASNADICVGIFSEERCGNIRKILFMYRLAESLSSKDVENHRRWRVENHKYLWQLF